MNACCSYTNIATKQNQFDKLLKYACEELAAAQSFDPFQEFTNLFLSTTNNTLPPTIQKLDEWYRKNQDKIPAIVIASPALCRVKQSSG
mgnify:CR=1 FL=1